MYIKITGLNKSIKKVPILSDINIEFQSGRIYGLKGSNGSGKTMLMRAISGLILADSGSVDINGKILGKDISFPDSLGILIENPSFISGYTSFKNLKMLASIQGRIDDDDEINRAIERVGLDPKDKRTYKKYSLGMKQRLGIACAIMEKPEIIILDEPVNALDENGVELVREILQEEKNRGALIIIACHDKEELEFLSDEIYIICDGKILDHYIKNDNKKKLNEEILSS